MAIQIDSSLNLNSGAVVNNAYLRIEYGVNRYGNLIVYDIFPYLTREKYIEDKGSNGSYVSLLDINNLLLYGSMAYDKDVDGPDVLQLVHNHIYSYLTEDETTTRSLRDPSTGEVIIDPSTGEEEKETIVFREKFFSPEDVSIIDLI